MHDRLTQNKSCIDLHIHSTCSDGRMTPEQIFDIARKRGLEAISITDHDTVAATATAFQLAKKVGVEFVPGIEISVAHAHCEVHLLGYFIDASSPALKEDADLLTASRMRAASSCRPRPVSSIIAAERIMARGLAMFLPAAWG